MSITAIKTKHITKKLLLSVHDIQQNIIIEKKEDKEKFFIINTSDIYNPQESLKDKIFKKTERFFKYFI